MNVVELLSGISQINKKSELKGSKGEVVESKKKEDFNVALHEKGNNEVNVKSEPDETKENRLYTTKKILKTIEKKAYEQDEVPSELNSLIVQMGLGTIEQKEGYQRIVGDALYDTKEYVGDLIGGLNELKLMIDDNNDFGTEIGSKFDVLLNKLENFLKDIDITEGNPFDAKETALNITSEFYEIRNDIMNQISDDNRFSGQNSEMMKLLAISKNEINKIEEAMSGDVVIEQAVDIFDGKNQIENEMINALEDESIYSSKLLYEGVSGSKDGKIDNKNKNIDRDAEIKVDDSLEIIEGSRSQNDFSKVMKDSVKTIDNLKSEMVDKVEQFQKLITAKDKILVQLNPKNLGNVEIFLKKTKEGIEITVDMEKKESKKQIETIIEDVKKEFREKNIDLNVVYRESEKEKKEEENEKKNEKLKKERTSNVEESFKNMISEILG